MARPDDRPADPVQETLLILNPLAGGGGHDLELHAWRTRLPNLRVRKTADASDTRRWARDAARDGVATVVAGGGDGTAHQVANGILDASGSSTALGILPLGTGNDLARSLGIPLDPEGALTVLAKGATRSMDVIRVFLDENPPRFILNALTGGFSGRIHEKLDEEAKARWGPLSYLRWGMELWGERHIHHLEVVEEGRTRSHRVLNLMVCNGAYAGAGLPIAPSADPFDGLLDVSLILDAPPLALSTLAAHMLSGRGDEHEALARYRLPSVRIRADSPIPLSLDGEPTEASQVRAEVDPGRIRVRVPGGPGR